MQTASLTWKRRPLRLTQRLVVRQVVVASLGHQPTVAGALKVEKRVLKRLNQCRATFVPAVACTGRRKRQIDALDRMIAQASEKITALKTFLWIDAPMAQQRRLERITNRVAQIMVGTTPEIIAKGWYLGLHAPRRLKEALEGKLSFENAYRMAVGLPIVEQDVARP